MNEKCVVIIGGGVTGLSCAYFLAERGRAMGLPLRVLLVEAEGRWGGKVRTEQADGFTLEGGPDSFITAKPWGTDLCDTLGVPLVSTNPTEKAIYILSGGRLSPLPTGMNLMVPGQIRPFLLSPLVSLAGKVRMGFDLLIPRQTRPDLRHDESIAAFVRRRLGEEAVHQFAEPILAGIYAGDVERLSIQATFPQFPALERTHGSLIWGLWMQRWDAQKSRTPKAHRFSLFVRPSTGVGGLIRALHDRLDPASLYGGKTVTGLRLKAGRYVVQMGDETRIADAVVATVHTHLVAGWVAAWDAVLPPLLRQIQYVSTASVAVGFKKEDVPHPLDGFGYVAPRREGRKILAVTWSSTKFPGCAPPGQVLLRVFLGGAHQEHLVEQDDATLMQAVREELRLTLGIEANPVMARIFRWIKANPQYHVGHLARVAEIEKQAAIHPGLFLTGAPYHGVGIPDCIHQAEQTAEKALQFLFPKMG